MTRAREGAARRSVGGPESGKEGRKEGEVSDDEFTVNLRFVEGQRRGGGGRQSARGEQGVVFHSATSRGKFIRIQSREGQSVSEDSQAIRIGRGGFF